MVFIRWRRRERKSLCTSMTGGPSSQTTFREYMRTSKNLQKGRAVVIQIILCFSLISCSSIYLGQEDWDYEVSNSCNVSVLPDSFSDPKKIEMWIYKNIEYSTDLEQYETAEYRATPEETLQSMKGDCDDRAILFMYLYHQYFGEYSEYQSVLVYSKATDLTSGHAIVLVSDAFYMLGSLDVLEMRKTFSYGEIMYIAQNTPTVKLL